MSGRRMEGLSAEQRELISMKETQLIVDFLMRERDKEIEPVFDLQLACRYPVVEKLTGLDAARVLSLLPRLAEAGILKPRPSFKIPCCSFCGSANLG